MAAGEGSTVPTQPPGKKSVSSALSRVQKKGLPIARGREPDRCSLIHGRKEGRVAARKGDGIRGGGGLTLWAVTKNDAGHPPKKEKRWTGGKQDLLSLSGKKKKDRRSGHDKNKALFC